MKKISSSFTKEKNKSKRNKEYQKYIDNISPKHKPVQCFFKAYLVGGIICCIGELIKNILLTGLAEEEAAAYTTIILVLLSVILTGFNIYQKIASFAGAGTIVPITGFANSITAPAIEYKKEGQVFGIGCKIFSIAGPVILYGIFSSSLIGCIYLILKNLKII